MMRGNMLETIVLKRGLRADRVWTHPLMYKSAANRIPLFFDTWALMRSQYWPRKKLGALQEKRLSELFAECVRIPFWHDVLAHAPSASSPYEKLTHIPVTTKQTLNARGLGDIADMSLIARSDPDHTSGSTGKPFHFYQDWHASLRSFAVTERIFRTATNGTRYPIVYMRTRPRNGFTFYRHIWFYVRGYNSIRYRMDELRKLGERFPNGFVLYGYTSWVVELARRMEEHALRLPIRAVMVAGEHLTTHDRVYIEHVMRAELFTLYASRELGFLGYECAYHRMHLNEEWAYVEIVDGEGKPVPAGHEGRIVVTAFDNRVMPFIRYDIGDIGSVSDIPCPCGRTLRTLEFRGRTSELIRLDGDRTVSLLDVAYKLGSYRDVLRQYQIIQTGALSFVFRIVPGPLFEEMKESLEATMVGVMHPRVRIQWDVTDVIPEASSGKATYFVRDF